MKCMHVKNAFDQKEKSTNSKEWRVYAEFKPFKIVGKFNKFNYICLNNLHSYYVYGNTNTWRFITFQIGCDDMKVTLE